MSTTQLKNLVNFGLTCGELFDGLMDGVGFDDVAKLIAVARQASGAISGAKAAFEQYKNMTDDEALELEIFVQEEFSISNEQVEAVIEQALKVVIQLHELVKLILPNPIVPLANPEE